METNLSPDLTSAELKVKVSVEGPESTPAERALAAYTVEGTLYKNFSGAETKHKPEIEARLEKRPASEDAVGHAANATLKVLLNQPKLWSAEMVSVWAKSVLVLEVVGSGISIDLSMPKVRGFRKALS